MGRSTISLRWQGATNHKENKQVKNVPKLTFCIVIFWKKNARGVEQRDMTLQMQWKWSFFRIVPDLKKTLTTAKRFTKNSLEIFFFLISNDQWNWRFLSSFWEMLSITKQFRWCYKKSKNRIIFWFALNELFQMRAAN